MLGAILYPDKRTVSAVLRVMGLSKERTFGKYHRVLSRAVWSSRKVSRRLLVHLIGTFAPSGVVVMGIDDTVERRKGKRIRARGLLGLFSLVTLLAHALQMQHPLLVPQAAWYSKSLPTFVDALAAVRRALWLTRLFERSTLNDTSQKVPPELLQVWSDLLCYAA